jgi:hypothetical protein
MIHKKYLLVVVTVALVLSVLTLLAACTETPATNEKLPTPPSMPEAEEPEEIAQPEEVIAAEEPDEPVIYLSNLTFELKHQILMGQFGDFLKKYPVKLESSDDKDSWIHEFHFKGDGNRYMVSTVQAANIHQAQINLENAYSLLDKGKLPGESESRALHKAEVAREMESAINLLNEQQLLMPDREEECIQWVRECEIASINNEKTVVNIVETYDDYEQRLSKILALLTRILSDLPDAVEK